MAKSGFRKERLNRALERKAQAEPWIGRAEQGFRKEEKARQGFRRKRPSEALERKNQVGI